MPSLDVTVWCDVELDVAVRCGMARDSELGRRHEALWTDVWVLNDGDFAQELIPRQHAEMLHALSP